MHPLFNLKTPLWIAALATGAKSFAANPVIGSRRLNARGLHAGRVRLAARMASWRRARLARRLSEEDRQAFARDGFILKENFLPQAEFEQLRREVMESDWDVREMHQGGAITRRVPLDPAPLRASHPMLARLAADPAVANLIRYVAGAGGQPIFSLQAILAGYGAAGGHDPQTDLHADTFHSTAKAWLFMHDVADDEGPFSYVPGSHQATAARVAWEKEQSLTAAEHPLPYHARGSFRIRPEELEKIGLPPAKRMVVKANTLIVADTFGFHARTASAVPTCRVEIYASLRRNPFLPWLGLDPLSLPYVRERIGSMSIWGLEQLKKVGLAKMPWRPVGRMRIHALPASRKQQG